MLGNHKFDKSIFRAYDIRGIVGETLTVKDAFFIGYNFGTNIGLESFLLKTLLWGMMEG